MIQIDRALRTFRFLTPCLLTLTLTTAPALAQPDALIAGRNVNMVAGTEWPNGDPFLQRQNEPSIAVSSRNPLHLMSGSNDYRTVDLPGPQPGKASIGESWISTNFSADGGARWISRLLPGYPQDTSPIGLASPLRTALDGAGYEASADPVIRSGTHGLLYYSGIAFTRSEPTPSAGFVATYIDLNNDERGNSIGYVGTSLFDHNDDGSSFIDKPWIAVDKPRSGSTFRTFDVHTDEGIVANQTVECGNVYAAYARIQGDGTLAISSQMMFTRSSDCAQTFSAPLQLSAPNTINQGAAIAVDPLTGDILVAWRQFENATLSCTHPAIYWRDNPEAWPVEELELAGLTFNQGDIDQFFFDLDDVDDLGDLIRELLAWFSSGTVTRDGVFRQLLAAWLNGLSGADTADVADVMDEAEAWLVANPPGSQLSRSERREGVQLWLQLLYYNWGLTGPGRCDALGQSGLSGQNPNAIMVVRSDDFGATFSAPVAVTGDDYFPFEQGTTEFSFRTTGYPTMTFDGEGRAYLAYATRGMADPTGADPDPVGGDSRIAVTTSMNGIDWTEPRAIDAPAVPGHQLMPALESASGKVFLLYYDFRADVAGVHDRFIVDLPVDLTTPRHSTDVRAAQADAADVPVFTDYSVLNGHSTQTSRYPFLVLEDAGSGEPYGQQMLYNPPNLPMFKGGTVPFFGDYIDLAAQHFVVNAFGEWDFDTDPARGAPVVHAVWTDNRDVVGPPDGDWGSYVPPGERDPDQQSLFDPSQTVEVCEGPAAFDRTKMRNQNVYGARLTQGLALAVPGNNRPLAPPAADLHRVFVAFAQNLTESEKTFALTILNQPPGGSASFEQFDPTVTEVTEAIEAHSSISRSIFVTSTQPTASVDIRVAEVDASGAEIPGGLTATARINPDPSAPQPVAGNILTEEIYTPAIFNPAIFNPAIFNPALLGDDPEVGIYNPAIFNPAIFNAPEDPEYVIWALTQLALLNPAIFNPAIFNPAIFNPAVFNPAIFNPAIFNPAIFNPAIFNPAIFNPAIFNPAIFNPAIFNPAIFNTSMVETSVVVENEGNTTAAYSLNLDLENPPEGFLFQVMIYKTYLVPSADGCELTETPEQEPLISVLTADVEGDLNDPNATTFYVPPGDNVVITVRIVPDPNAIPPGNPADIDTLDELDLVASIVPQAVDTPGLIADLTEPTPLIIGTPPAGFTVVETAVAVASDGVTDDRFGSGVAVSGTTAVAGAFVDDPDPPTTAIAGYAYVYDLTGASSPLTEIAKLVPGDGGTNTNAQFGAAAAIDGSTAVIGAPGNGFATGAIYVFDLAGASGTMTEDQRLFASDANFDDSFGQSIAIDGDMMIVGAPRHEHAASAPGGAYLFTLDGGVWSEQAELRPTAPLGSDTSFGRSVALSGSLALVSAYTEEGTGIPCPPLTPDCPHLGAVYVFDLTGASGIVNEIAKLLPGDTAPGMHFGDSVALSGTTALIGASDGNGNVDGSGSAYVFDLAGVAGTVMGGQKIYASDGALGDRFGGSVALDGTLALIGAPFDDPPGAVVISNLGSIYAFDLTGTTCAEPICEIGKVVASNAAADDRFGTSVSISGGTGFVGSLRGDGNAPDSGAAYVISITSP